MKTPGLVALACTLFFAGSLRELTAEVGLIEIDGAIGPATAGYVSRAISVSSSAGQECLVVRLDTPGGLLDSTQEIVQAFYRSPRPVVVYVAPEGANAGSAGCFITLAADVAAMAPNSSIGAAHPVALGAGGGEISKVIEEKMENFAASYIEAIANRTGRNAEWAISAVRDSASVTSEKALELGVIDLIATDWDDLLSQLHGREIQEAVLDTQDATLVAIPMLARERVFQMLWRPEVMFVLMLVAIYGLVGELSNPGAIFPGVTGAIALILVLYMASILPVNVAGVALIGLAIALFVAEALTPTFGAFTAGGAVAFLLGSMMLFDPVEPAFRLSLAMVLPATLMTTLFFATIVTAGLRAQRLPIKAGPETMVGRGGTVLSDIEVGPGRVLIDGEDWQAVGEVTMKAGSRVEVVATEGLRLVVKPRNEEDL